MSSTQDLQWLLTRKSSSYIVKQKGLGRIFSREPDNLAALHSYKHSGLVNDKAVGIQPSPSGKGVVVNTKKSNKKVGGNKVASKRNSTTISKGGSRRTSGAVAKIVGKNGYRSDLLKDAVARSSAICRSQRPSGRKSPPARKTRGSGPRKVVIDKTA